MEEHNRQCNANVNESDDSVQSRAYQIYLEKGGYALDNWLEAEQLVKNNKAGEGNVQA